MSRWEEFKEWFGNRMGINPSENEILKGATQDEMLSFMGFAKQWLWEEKGMYIIADATGKKLPVLSFCGLLYSGNTGESKIGLETKSPIEAELQVIKMYFDEMD